MMDYKVACRLRDEAAPVPEPLADGATWRHEFCYTSQADSAVDYVHVFRERAGGRVERFYTNDRDSEAPWEQLRARLETALEPLDFVAPRDARIRHKTPGGADRERRPGPGCRIYFGPHDDSDFAWSLRFYGAESSVCAADVPRVYEELCKLRDEADWAAGRETCLHMVGYIDDGGNEVCGQCQKVLRKSGDEPRVVESFHIPAEELNGLQSEMNDLSERERAAAATNMTAVMKRTWTVPLNPHDRAVIEAETGWRAQMVNAVISQQVAAGGVDTEGTRAEAERWCSACCEGLHGLRELTDQSKYKLEELDGGWRLFELPASNEDIEPEYYERLVLRGTPLGKP